MKNVILIISFLMGSVLASAQTQIPNSDFEDWTIAANGTDSLAGWSSSNSIVISPVISLYSDSDSYQGDFAANLVTAPFGFVQYSTIGVLVNGEATFSYGGGGGGDNIAYVSGGGTPISYKPAELNGYYKTTTLSMGDLPFVKVLASKYDFALNQRDTVIYAEFNFTASANYSSFSIPLIDMLPGVIPDTVTTAFYSSNPVLVNPFDVWSNLFLDNISLSATSTTGIELSPSKASNMKVFPNPATGVFIIQNLAHSNMRIDVYNQLGVWVKVLHTEPNESLTIDMHDYPSGVYFLKSDIPSGLTEKLILIK